MCDDLADLYYTRHYAGKWDHFGRFTLLAARFCNARSHELPAMRVARVRELGQNTSESALAKRHMTFAPFSYRNMK